MKKGLSYISERTGEIRAADNAENIKWFHPLSEYIPIETIRRGEAVSIATVEDINEIAENIYSNNADKAAALKAALTATTNSYIVRTRPSRHTSAIGLAEEYVKVEIIKNEDNTFELPTKVCHIVGNGQYVEDIDYVFESVMVEDKTSYENRIEAIVETEYVPDFFKNYEKNIGKKVYVDATAADNGNPGLLTTNKEDAYLSYNNVIVIGFISDAYTPESEIAKENVSNIHVGAIEVQIEGDDRGAVDATQNEAILGEDVIIPSKNPVKIFALGNDDDTSFSFNLSVYPNNFTEDTKPGFIAFQKMDGNTVFITNDKSYFNDEFNTFDDVNDRAFIQIAEYYTQSSISENSIIETSDFTQENFKSILDEAIAKISTDFNGETSFKSGAIYNKVRKFDYNGTTDPTTTGNYLLKANAVDNDGISAPDGYYEIYVSKNWSSIFTDLTYISHGSLYNKGYAVLADLRFENRMNILGAYVSGKYDETLKRGSRATFMRQGLFTAPSNVFSAGQNYWLGTHGQILTTPIAFYDNVAKVGTAQDQTKLIISLSDVRKEYNGYLPVGFVKPSVNGCAEYGFKLMDGKTVCKLSEAEELYNFLHSQFGVELSAIEGDTDQQFTIPKMNYVGSIYSSDGSLSEIPAQIKYISDGIYYNTPRHPYMEISGTIQNNTISNADITDLIVSGPYADEIQIPSLENLEIKLFVNIGDSDSPKWVEVPQGFNIYNNFQYYGYRWQVERTQTPNEDYPNGKWELSAQIQGSSDNSEDKKALGIRFLDTPYAPPSELNNKSYKIKVTFRQYFERQYDIGSIFASYVKNTVMQSGSEGAWSGSAVSGKAVYDYINKSVSTKELSVTGTVVDELNSLKVTLNGAAENHTISGNFTLKGSNRDIIYDNEELNYSKIPTHNYYSTWATESSSTKYGTGINEESDQSVLAKLATVNDVATHAHRFIDNADAIIENNSLKYVHGINNNGYSGNLNANTLWGFKPSIAFRSLSENGTSALYGNNNLSASSENTTLAAFIPLMYKEDNNSTTKNYTFDVGNVINYNIYNSDVTNNNFITLTKTLSYDNNSITENIKVGNNSLTDVSYDLDGTITGKFNLNSSKSIKNINREYFNNNVTLTDKDEKNIINNDNLSAVEVLQALYELPLAEWKYSNNNSATKYYFGLITEHTAQMAEYIKTNSISGTTSFDNVEYTYTEDERNNIADFLGKLTDENDKSVNTISSLGILMKAAQETQKRLLNLEVSTYGKDSPTLPGEDELKVTETWIVNNKTTIYVANKNVYDSLKNKYNSLSSDNEKALLKYESTYYLNNNILISDYENAEYNGYTYTYIDTFTGKISKHIDAQDATETTEAVEESNITYNIIKEYDVDQKSTTLGLNRLIKALCREIYQTTDPSFDDFGKAIVQNSSISRIDQLDEAVFGSNAVAENNETDIELNSSNALSYPDKISDSEEKIYSHEQAMYLDADDDDKYNFNETNYTSYSVKNNENYTLGKFDGLNDAVNKITLKLNKLTEYIVGADNINNKPEKLNIIRANIQTILKELYNNAEYKFNFEYDKLSDVTIDEVTFIKKASSEKYGEYKFTPNEIKSTSDDGTVAEQTWKLVYNYENNSGTKQENTSDPVKLADYGIVAKPLGTENSSFDTAASIIITYEKGPYENIDGELNYSYNKNVISGSRLDNVIKALYNYQFTNSSAGTTIISGNNLCVNGKNVCLETKTNESTYTALAPNTVEEFNQANIIDVIIDILGDNTSNILKAATTSQQTLVGNSNNNIIQTTTDIEEKLTSNESYFKQKSVLSRLNTIEQILQLMTLRFQNNWTFDTFKTAVETSYANNITNKYSYKGVKSVDSFMNNIADILGVAFDGKNNTLDISVSNNSGKLLVKQLGTECAIKAENISTCSKYTPTVTIECATTNDNDEQTAICCYNFIDKGTYTICTKESDASKISFTKLTYDNNSCAYCCDTAVSLIGGDCLTNICCCNTATVSCDDNSYVNVTLTINNPGTYIINSNNITCVCGDEKCVFVAPKNTYGILYDTVARLRQAEYNINTVNAFLGCDYGGNCLLCDDTLLTCDLSSGENICYTITNDITNLYKRLFFNSCHCCCCCCNTSIIDCLYKNLYCVPQAYQINNNNGLDKINNNKIDNSCYYFDPTSPKKTAYNCIESAYRCDCFYDNSYKSRIDIAEEAIAALYNYIGLGCNNCENYYNGKFCCDKCCVNGQSYCSTSKTNLTYFAMNGYDTATSNKTDISCIKNWICSATENTTENITDWPTIVNCANQASIANKVQNNLTIVYDKDIVYQACCVTATGTEESKKETSPLYYAKVNNCLIFYTKSNNSYTEENSYDLTLETNCTDYYKLSGTDCSDGSYQYNNCYYCDSDHNLYNCSKELITCCVEIDCDSKITKDFNGCCSVCVDLTEYVSKKELDAQVLCALSSEKDNFVVNTAETACKLNNSLTFCNEYKAICDENNCVTGYQLQVNKETTEDPITFDGSSGKCISIVVPCASAETSGIISSSDYCRFSRVAQANDSSNKLNYDNLSICNDSTNKTICYCQSEEAKYNDGCITYSDSAINSIIKTAVESLRTESKFYADNEANISNVLLYVGNDAGNIDRSAIKLHNYDSSNTINIGTKYYCVNSMSNGCNYNNTNGFQIKASICCKYGLSEVYYYNATDCVGYCIYIASDNCCCVGTVVPTGTLGTITLTY